MMNFSVSLRAGETKVLFLRPHWIILVRAFALTLLLGALPFMVGLLLAQWGVDLTQSVIAHALVVLASSAYALAVLLFLGYAFIDYWLDMWTVTTKRIFHVEQKGLFDREIDELELIRIQDCTSETKGIVATLLGYGTISVQTAAEMPRFVFHIIPHPEEVRELIVKLMREARAAGKPT